MEVYFTLIGVVVGGILPILVNSIVEKPRTKRRIRLELIQNVYQFYHLLRAQFEYINYRDFVYQHLFYLRNRSAEKSANETEPFKFEMQYQENQLKMLSSMTADAFKALVAIEAGLLKLNSEVSDNFSKSVAMKVNDFILAALAESNTSHSVGNYKDLKYPEFLVIEPSLKDQVTKMSDMLNVKAIQSTKKLNKILT